MAKIIAITNQKGGVGKTTTSINLAASFAVMKRRVMLIDFDPQGNATVGSGIRVSDLKSRAMQALLGEVPLASAIVSSKAGYDVLPTHQELIVAEMQLLQRPSREFTLKKLLEPFLKSYDYILIDCPPSLSVLTVNALVAAHSVLIPVQCEYFALEGLSGLLSTIKQLQDTVNPELKIEGLLRTMYDGRNKLATDVSEQLLSHFNDKVYRTVIPRNIRLAEAPSHGTPVIQFDRKSLGALAYLALAGEILRREH